MPSLLPFSGINMRSQICVLTQMIRVTDNFVNKLQSVGSEWEG
jgi:hypothetical protein